MKKLFAAVLLSFSTAAVYAVPFGSQSVLVVEEGGDIGQLGFLHHVLRIHDRSGDRSDITPLGLKDNRFCFPG